MQLKHVTLLQNYHSMIINGETYVVVLTKEFPQVGISGGDFVPIDRFFPDISDFKWN